jgi:hypothetical protein
MIIKTVDEKLHRSIEEENTQKIPPMKGILLPWHPQMKDTLRDDNLFYDESCPESCIIDLLGSIAFGFRMVVEDHRSSTGVILVDLQPYNKTIGTKRTTIVSSIPWTNDMDHLTKQFLINNNDLHRKDFKKSNGSNRL